MNKMLFFKLTFLTSLLFITACSNDGLLRPPFNVPFKAQYAGETVSVDFKITKDRAYVYEFDLEFIYEKDNEKEKAYLNKSIRQETKRINGDLLEVGLSVPLRLTLEKQQHESYEVLIDEDFIHQDLTSWGSGAFSKLITKRRFEPGIYRLTLTSQATLDNPERLNINLNVARSRAK